MAKKLKCVLGIHDWHLIERKDSYSIEVDLANQLDPLKDGEVRGACVSSNLIFEHKECLDCGEVSNTIEKYKKNQLARMQKIINKFGVNALEPQKRDMSGFRIPPKGVANNE